MRKWGFASLLVVVLLHLATVQGQVRGQGPGQGLAPNQGQGQGRGRGRGSAAPFVDGELLVKFDRSVNAFRRGGLLASWGTSRIRHFDPLDIDLVRTPRGLSVAAAVQALSRIPGVMAVQPNYTRRAIQNAPPNDPYWLDGSLWGLQKIDAPSAWSGFTPGNGSVVVAVIDTGVSYTHPDLAANMWQNPFEIPGNHIDDDGNGYIDDVYGIDTANDDGDPMDDQGHGTHTAGTVAAVGNNALGVVGVNWNAKLLACKFLDASGYGTDAGAIECFNYVVAMRNRGENIRVTSNSWGETRTGAPDTVLQAAIDAAGDVGIVNVFGAGNNGVNNDVTPFDPASYASDSIISVASSNSRDRRSSFSNYGGASVDLAAPGENILSTYLGGDYAFLSGTSMATPHVAGAAALLASMDPTLSVAAIKACLLDNVDRSGAWNGRVVSGGRLNVFKAAMAVVPGGNNTPPTVSILAPADGAIYKEPAAIAIEATTADEDGSIQRVSFYANGAPIGTATASPFSVAWTNVPAGDYTLTAVATDDGWATTASVPVHVSVLANQPPTVWITSPAEGATFTSPAVVTVTAEAVDGDGQLSSVTFFADGVPIGTDATAPYSAVWAAKVGPHVLTATSTDDMGATGSSTAVSVTIDPLPGRTNVALAANGGVASASSTLNANYPPSAAINGDRRGLNWGAGGGWNDGTLYSLPDWLEVDFHGEKLIEEVNVFSMQDNYTAPADPTPTMTFQYFGLRAFDVQYWTGTGWAVVPGGAISNNTLVWRQVTFPPLATTRIRVFITGSINYSSVMEVEAIGVSTGTNTAPSVAITSPADGTTHTTPVNVTVNAAASDADGTVQQVAFYANGIPIGTDTTSPYSVNWAGVAAGTYTLTAVATDDGGATTTSAAIAVTVIDNAAPAVSISSPAAGTALTAPATVTIAADATDSDGSVASVAFYANGALIGTDTTSPYAVTWSNPSIGTYALTAVATDNHGATTTSAAVQVAVVANPNRKNHAAAANGGVASASSILNANYPASGAIDGDRRGLNWGVGGGWNDGTSYQFPDWLEVDFNGVKTIDEINVFSLQDSYNSPSEPTPTMAFTSFGLRGFDVQYWNGSAWETLPGGGVSNNTLVWRQVLFAPVSTTKIRVYVTAALFGSSRIVEVEAWGTASAANAPPGVTLTSPADGTALVAPATVTLTADADDPDGSVQTVAFFANGVPIGTDSTGPYSVIWSGAPAGSYTLTAVVTDNDGAETTSAPIQVTVAENQAPTVALTNPPDGTTILLPASVTIDASAADADGTIAWVAFYANGTLLATDTTAPYSAAWIDPDAGVHTLTAVAVDDRGATASSSVSVTVAAQTRTNFALASNGGVATASSTLHPVKYPAAGAINGDRLGLNWGSGGGWNDSTSYVWPDWLEVAFDGPKTIDEVDVFSLQDAYGAPAEPTPAMTFTLFGLRAFEVQYWNGSSWVTAPGGTVTNNNLVWRQVLFAPVTTTKVRVNVTAALYGSSRVVELEAWGVGATQGAAAACSPQAPACAPAGTSASLPPVRRR